MERWEEVETEIEMEKERVKRYMNGEEMCGEERGRKNGKRGRKMEVRLS